MSEIFERNFAVSKCVCSRTISRGYPRNTASWLRARRLTRPNKMRAAFTVEFPQVSTLRALNYSPFVEAFRAKRKSKKSFALPEVLDANGISYGYAFPRRDCDPGFGI